MSLGFEGSPLGNPNDCDDPYAPSFWLGKPGALTQIRMPDANYTRPYVDSFASHQLLDGQSVDRSPYQCRVWTMSHQWLKPDVASVLFEYATRQRGIGPFIFVDPHMRNILTPNQASGTDSLHTTEGFAVSGTGSALSSSTAEYYQGERSLLWTLTPPITGTAGTLRVVSPTGLYGFCAPVGKTVAFSGVVKAGMSADPSVSVTVNLVFMNGVGAVQSTVSSSPITTVTGSGSAGWSSFCVTGAVPAAAVGTYFEPQLVVTGSSVSAVANVHLDQLQLEIKDTGGGCSTWEYGQGQPLVAVRAENESVPRILRSNMGFLVVEVT